MRLPSTRAIKALAKHGAEALRAQPRADGRWSKAAVTRREAADVRRAAYALATTSSASSGEGAAAAALAAFSPSAAAAGAAPSAAAAALAAVCRELPVEPVWTAAYEEALGKSTSTISTRPVRRHTRERTRENRASQIERKMDEMPAKIEKCVARPLLRRAALLLRPPPQGARFRVLHTLLRRRYYSYQLTRSPHLSQVPRGAARREAGAGLRDHVQAAQPQADLRA